MTETAQQEKGAGQKTRMSGISKTVVIVVTTIGILISINQLFQLKAFGFMPVANGYFYYILATFLSISYLLFPARVKDKHHIQFYDWLLFLLCVGVNLYFAFHAYSILTLGWEFSAPLTALVMSYVLWALGLEAVRRTGGWLLFFICLVISFYPLYGQYMKGMLWGIPFTLAETATFHAMGQESIIGIATKVVGNSIIGYLIFGAAIVVSGGGTFFMNMALALLGKSRGGAAKVSILSSAFMASLSGSVVSNVVTTGTLTIPAMQKAGYKPEYAAAVEACASTGGTITPPIMGAAGFLIASFLGVSYAQVMAAAIFPAFLYFFVLFLQTDFYAAKNGIDGLSSSELPRLKSVLKNGWPFIFAMLTLIVVLLFYRITALAPFYTIVVLFICSSFNKNTRMTFQKFKEFIYESGVVISHITAVLAGIGLIVGAFSATGVANSFSRDLLLFAGDNTLLLLLLGALTSFVLGIGMTVTACYVFLAVVLVPALVTAGFDPLAAHLFVMFCGNISYITPPVALGAIAAATIAGSNALKTGVTAMRLGVILIIVPFIFVMNPALILHGTLPEICYSVTICLFGAYWLAVALEGWVPYFGLLSMIGRAFLLVGSGFILYPKFGTEFIGLVFVLAFLGYLVFFKKNGRILQATSNKHD